MSPILPSLLRLLINFVLNSPILENRWSTKFQQLFTICHILTKRKLSYYLFFLHPTIKEQMLNIQNIPRWKSSWFRRDKYELTIKQCFTSICPWQYQNCQSNTRLQKGSKLFTSSYRPISIWPCFSKFSDLIDEYYIFSGLQFSSRKRHSTCLAMINLFENNSWALDDKEFAIGSFLDLSKAFDTVSTKFLLKSCSTMAYAELP